MVSEKFLRSLNCSLVYFVIFNIKSDYWSSLLLSFPHEIQKKLSKHLRTIKNSILNLKKKNFKPY